MIMEMLDAFGIATAGAPDYEADDVLGTLAARERRDPVVVVSGDRDLLQLVCDDPVQVQGALPGPRHGQGDEVRPGRGSRAVRRAGRSGRTGLRRVGAAAGRSLRRPARRGGYRRENGGHPAGPVRLTGAIVAAAHDPKSKMSTAYRKKLLAATDYIERAEPVVRVATDAAVTLSTLPTPCRWPPSTRARSPIWPARWVSRHRSGDCRKRSTGSAVRACAATWAGRPRRCRRRPGTSRSPAAWCRRC